MARRSEHSQEQIRDMVLNAAENIIVEDGIQALTVRKIALEIGYTVGSIFIVFANMQDLLMHIKGRTLDQLAAQLQAISDADGIEQQIGVLAGNYLKFVTGNFNRWRIIFEPCAQDDEAIPGWYREKTEQMFAPIEALFRQLKPESNAEEVRLAARTLWCGVHGVCVLSLNGNLGRAGLENTEAAVHLLVDNFIQGWKR